MSVLKHTEESNFGEILYRFEILQDEEDINIHTMRLYVATELGDASISNCLGLNLCGKVWMLCYSESFSATSIKRAVSKAQLEIATIMESATSTMK